MYTNQSVSSISLCIRFELRRLNQEELLAVVASLDMDKENWEAAKRKQWLHLQSRLRVPYAFLEEEWTGISQNVSKEKKENQESMDNS